MITLFFFFFFFWPQTCTAHLRPCSLPRIHCQATGFKKHDYYLSVYRLHLFLGVEEIEAEWAGKHGEKVIRTAAYSSREMRKCLVSSAYKNRIETLQVVTSQALVSSRPMHAVEYIILIIDDGWRIP